MSIRDAGLALAMEVRGVALTLVAFSTPRAILVSLLALTGLIFAFVGMGTRAKQHL